ncbi:TonB-dependent receptor (plasmid) [Sphingomonas panacis]|uniref:TonB-dependent receptor n=1 Tax=Sphingomonas panacis TaxID=1560345 RepID=A0A1B3ZIS7_9SPHN|nr:TonB-dependent receptor [Sphingomonas panacis]
MFAQVAAAQQAGSVVAPASPVVQASGVTSNEPQVGDIIVTAQKRSERLNDVPMSITASTSDQLKSAGVTSTDDLAKIVPGFTFLKSSYGTPIYFIRGIGFNDTTLGVSPAVTVYVDQAPLPYSPMSRGATLDLERVEILKGPQGTLFGQNSTGGAINYIAAKPTDHLEAGFDLGFGRFNAVDTEAFISGPITNTLKVRLAVRQEYQDDWQKSYVSSDTIGQKRFINGRAMLDWDPSSTFHVALTASAWKDTSDTQQPQFVLFRGPDSAPAHLPIPYPIDTFPAAPKNDRAAAWDPGVSFARNDRFYQFTGRADWNLMDDIALTSLTSYANYKTFTPLDLDGTIYPVSRTVVSGMIKSFSQELRLNGTAGDRLRWMLGGSYQKDTVNEEFRYDPQFTTNGNIGPFVYHGFGVTNDQSIRTAGVFGSLDFAITDKITLQGSARYTDQHRRYQGCGRDDGDGDLAAAFDYLAFLLSGTAGNIPPGGCVTLNATTGVPGLVHDQLNQNNVSWRASVNYKPRSSMLFYANVTKGYKSGSFPTQPPPTSAALNPVNQESVLAYEVGTKIDLFRRKVQLTAAAFYYDYRDKQLLGTLNLPPFGALPALVNIPMSRVEGAEFNATLLPLHGLRLNVGGTYVDTRIKSDPPNPTGPFGSQGGSFVGSPFPFTPKWQGVADAQYTFPISSGLNMYLGGNVTARSKANASLFNGGSAVSPYDGASIAGLEKMLVIPGYALLDLRAGVETPDSKLRIEIWGRNVANKFYSTNIVRVSDYVYRFAGMPATYGVTLKFRFGQ